MPGSRLSRAGRLSGWPPAPLRRQPADRDAVDGQPLAVAEVGQDEHADGVAGRHHPGRGADAALEAQAAHPGAGADRPLGRSLAAGRARAASSAALTSAAVTCIRRASFRKLSSHSATIGMITSSAIPAVLGHQQLAGRVIDPAELHRRGQEDRRLGQAPLGGGQEAGALPGPVQHGAAGRHRVAEEVAAQVEYRHAGPRHAAALRGWRLVPPDGGVANADARHVGDRSGGAARQDADPDPQVSCSGHPAIMPGFGLPGPGAGRSRWSARRIRHNRAVPPAGP